MALAGLGVAVSRGWALLASRGRIFSAAEAPAVDVAVVLGAGVLPDGRPSTYLASRLDRALELHRAGRAAVLVVSGAVVGDADEPRVMRHYLEQRGVDPRLVVEDREGVDTYATCRRARQVYGLRRVALVSQAYHLPRALGIARATGLDAIGVADRTVRDHPATDPATWVYGELREWLAGVKVLGDLVRPRPEDADAHDPAVRQALDHASRGAAYGHPADEDRSRAG
ncbi:hypothetical protein ADJ73_13945 [Arsenicicoccus sp. oral taxon 190]|nr:hypothetical protein ADJ73_13945 [Arsenicicoccus sp. oral taxon 190]